MGCTVATMVTYESIEMRIAAPNIPPAMQDALRQSYMLYRALGHAPWIINNAIIYEIKTRRQMDAIILNNIAAQQQLLAQQQYRQQMGQMEMPAVLAQQQQQQLLAQQQQQQQQQQNSVAKHG